MFAFLPVLSVRCVEDAPQNSFNYFFLNHKNVKSHAAAEQLMLLQFELLGPTAQCSFKSFCMTKTNFLFYPFVLTNAVCYKCIVYIYDLKINPRDQILSLMIILTNLCEGKQFKLQAKSYFIRTDCLILFLYSVYNYLSLSFFYLFTILLHFKTIFNKLYTFALFLIVCLSFYNPLYPKID